MQVALWLILPKKQYGVWAIMFSSETCIKIYKNENCKTLKYTMFSYRPTRLNLCSCIWDGWSTLSKLLCGCQLVIDRRTLRATAGAWDCFNPSKKWSMKHNIQWFFTSIQVPYAIQGTCLCLQVEQSKKSARCSFFSIFLTISKMRRIEEPMVKII